MPTSTAREYKDKHAKKGSDAQGEGEASQGWGVTWRGLLRAGPHERGAQNAFVGDSTARLRLKSSMTMGMVTGAAHR